MTDTKTEQVQEQEQAPKAVAAHEPNADGLPLPTRGTPDAADGCPALPLPAENIPNTVHIADGADSGTGALSDGDPQQDSSQAQDGGSKVSSKQAASDKAAS